MEELSEPLRSEWSRTPRDRAPLSVPATPGFAGHTDSNLLLSVDVETWTMSNCVQNINLLETQELHVIAGKGTSFGPKAMFLLLLKSVPLLSRYEISREEQMTANMFRRRFCIGELCFGSCGMECP